MHDGRHAYQSAIEKELEPIVVSENLIKYHVLSENVKA